MEIPVQKTIKLFMGGQFPRTESGRSFKLAKTDGSTFAQCCLGSRKDVRNAVEIAKKAQASWASKTAYNRSQILYRMAEMAQGKFDEFVEPLMVVAGMKEEQAKAATQAAIDTFVYYAGFADKYQQVVSSINPVSGPFHNFTSADPVGVVGALISEDLDLPKLVEFISSCISSGNSCVVILGQKPAALLAPLAEVFATSDLPGGVVNLISGDTEELYSHLASHMEVQSIYVEKAADERQHEIKDMAIDNLKRVVIDRGQQRCLDNISRFVEFKTVWHPVGQ